MLVAQGSELATQDALLKKLAIYPQICGMEMLIKTFAGLEEVLAQELRDLGAQQITPQKRAVRCEGDHNLLYRANLWLRTGIRVLVPVESFHADTEDNLYRQLLRVNWGSFLQLRQTFAIDVNTLSPQLTHSHFLALKTKDAIVDWFREHNNGKRPSVNTDDPDIRFHLHIDPRNEITLLLDSSGEGLHRRGYRTEGGEAPLNEALAAGLVLLSGYQGNEPFVDMMCGSGTLLIEAGMIAARQAPGLYRKFAFENWRDFFRPIYNDIKEEAKAARRPCPAPIIGVDNNFKAVRIADNNISAARLEDCIEVRRSSFQSFTPPPGPGWLIINPPYGLRVGHEEDVSGLYKAIGDKLKQDFAGYQAWIFSGNFEALKEIGLKPSRKIPLMNGPLECKLQGYELYLGSRK